MDSNWNSQKSYFGNWRDKLELITFTTHDSGLAVVTNRRDEVCSVLDVNRAVDLHVILPEGGLVRDYAPDFA